MFSPLFYPFPSVFLGCSVWVASLCFMSYQSFSGMAFLHFVQQLTGWQWLAFLWLGLRSMSGLGQCWVLDGVGLDGTGFDWCWFWTVLESGHSLMRHDGHRIHGVTEHKTW